MEKTQSDSTLPVVESPAPVMVGIDGSRSSLRAAVWATDEAIALDTPLRLIHVIEPVAAEHLDDAMTRAHRMLHQAWEVVADTGKSVKVESEVLRGEPAAELVEASRRAALLCVGHKGTKDSKSAKRGGTARAVALGAHCSTAVVRRPGVTHRPRSHRWIIGILDESPDARGVLEMALAEASRHDAPFVALTSWSTTTPPAEGMRVDDDGLRANLQRCLDRSRHDPTAVRVSALPMPDRLTHLLKQTAHFDQLVIVADNQPHVIEELLSEKTRAALRKSSCSLLILRRRVAPVAFDEDRG